MSILIKGMEMPKEGDFIVIRPDGKAYYVSANPQNAYEGEVIHVPPHGRVIDADAMFKNICDDINAMTAVGIVVDGQWLWNKLNDALGNASTIIPA